MAICLKSKKKRKKEEKDFICLLAVLQKLPIITKN